MFFWQLFCLILTAFLIRYSATPASPYAWRAGRTLLAFFMFYIVTSVWGWIEYTYYKSIGTRTLGAIWIHGLWFNIVYISFLEWLWRRHYRQSMISIKKGMGDDIVSNLFLLAAKIILFFTISFILLVIFMTIIRS